MRALFLLPLLVLLSACAGLQTTARPDAGRGTDTSTRSVFLIARHAEQADDGSNDPGLSEAGQARAQALATRLADTPLRAVYTTALRRTRDTAAPTAGAKDIEVRDYDGAQPASELATYLHIRHAGDTVLIIGHGNTVPDIVTALCACPVPALEPDAYGDLFRVTIDATGRAVLHRSHF